MSRSTPGESVSTHFFSGISDANEYLAARITEQANSEGAPLSSVERRMLYFSETGWTLSDMPETAAAFDREYEEAAYEEKVAGLIRRIHDRLKKGSPDERGAWAEAIRIVSQDDRYLAIMIQKARVKVRQPGDLAKLCLMGFTICCGLLLLAFLFPGFDLRLAEERFGVAIWASMTVAAIIYTLFYLIAGKTRKRGG